MKNPLPISFNANGARDIFTGIKTKTRRPVKESDMSCRYGQVGDKLWVREPFNLFLNEGWTLSDVDIHDPSGFQIQYPSTDGMIIGFDDKLGIATLRQSDPIHMPRWASRMTLEIINLRVENLQDIDENEIIQEGCPKGILYGTGWYKQEWEACYGIGSWDANPLVWVIGFKVL